MQKRIEEEKQGKVLSTSNLVHQQVSDYPILEI